MLVVFVCFMVCHHGFSFEKKPIFLCKHCDYFQTCYKREVRLVSNIEVIFGKCLKFGNFLCKAVDFLWGKCIWIDANMHTHLIYQLNDIPLKIYFFRFWQPFMEIEFLLSFFSEVIWQIWSHKRGKVIINLIFTNQFQRSTIFGNAQNEFKKYTIW
jgi:hypothetical protein